MKLLGEDEIEKVTDIGTSDGNGQLYTEAQGLKTEVQVESLDVDKSPQKQRQHTSAHIVLACWLCHE